MVRKSDFIIISALFQLLLGFNVSEGAEPIPFESLKDCTLSPDKEDKNLNQLGLNELAKHNPNCDHGKLLRSGNDIHVIYMHVMRKKSELLDVRIKEGSANLVELKKDGTCLDVPDETLTKCKKRMELLVIDAELSARNNIAANNKARTELISDQGQFSQTSVEPGLADTKKNLLKDFYKLSRSDNNRSALQKFLQNRDISFGTTKAGETLMGTTSLKEVKSESIEQRNPELAEKLDLKGPGLDVEADIENKAMTNDLAALQKVEKKRGLLERLSKEEEKKRLAAKGQTQKSNAPIDLTNSLSAQAFEYVMDDVLSAAVAKDAGKNGKANQKSAQNIGTKKDVLDTLNNASIAVPIASEKLSNQNSKIGKKPASIAGPQKKAVADKSQPLDDDIVERIKNDLSNP